MPPRVSDFNEYEQDLLIKCQSEYRGTPAAGKPAFRDALAKHFIEKRQEPQTAMLLELVSQGGGQLLMTYGFPFSHVLS